jgi:hypothetical protein
LEGQTKLDWGGNGVLIRDWHDAHQAGVLEVSADVDGFRLWFRVPESCPVSRSGDPFLAAALLPAMATGAPIEIEPTMAVSPRLLKNVARLQEIFHTWNPALKEVSITATTSPAEQLRPGAFTFFSAGVDSTYTFLKHLDDITHGVLIHGFDFYAADDTFKAAVERNAGFVATYGKTLLPVETSFYPFGHRYALSRLLTQGSCLGAVALLLGFPVAYVPSSIAYDQLVPTGSSPLTDPLWSNEAVEVVHDGCEAHRADKLRVVASSAPAVANLRVCENDMNVNCGRCSKCLRTMVPLQLLHADGAPFPPLPPLDVVLKAASADEYERVFLKEHLALASLDGDPRNAALRTMLRRALRRAETRRAVRELDASLLGGRLRRRLVRREVADSIDATPPTS